MSPNDNTLSWKIFAGAFVVLAVLAVGIIVLVRTSDDADDDDDVSAEVGVTDTFDRPANPDSLGTVPSGQPWEAVKGIWGVRDGHAYISESNSSGPRNLAVVDLGSGDGSVSARADRICPGWGLVFRYQGLYNFWAVIAQPDFASFNVVKFEDGQETSITRVSPAPATDGVVLRIDYEGPMMTVFTNDNPIVTVQDDHAKRATKVGMVGGSECADKAAWSEFRARPPGGVALVTVPPPVVAPPTTEAMLPESPFPDLGSTIVPGLGDDGGTSTTTSR